MDSMQVIVMEMVGIQEVGDVLYVAKENCHCGVYKIKIVK